MDIKSFVIRVIIMIIMWTLGSFLYHKFKNTSMKPIRLFFHNIRLRYRRMYRVLNPQKAIDYAWLELIKFHNDSQWKFGQFEKEKRISTNFLINEMDSINFNYTVEKYKLLFSSTILKSFDEERTNDVLVLASHFNGLLSFGSVKVNLKYNYVEFLHFGETLTYALFSGEIENDFDTHYQLSKDCYWSFTNLIDTGEDPVFVFSELLRRKDEENKASN